MVSVWWWWRIGDGGDLMVMRWKGGGGGGYKETSSCSRQMAWDDPNSCVILSLIGIFPLSCNRFHFHHFQCIYCCFIVVLIRTWWWWWYGWVKKRVMWWFFHNITTSYSPSSATLIFDRKPTHTHQDQSYICQSTKIYLSSPHSSISITIYIAQLLASFLSDKTVLYEEA